MSGLFNDDTLSLYLKLKEAMKQYVRDAMPGGVLNREIKPQDTLDAAALSLSPVPLVGDAAGLLADGYRYATDPSSRTPLNYGLSALGALPFVPSMVAPVAPRAAAMETARKNAVEMLGLPENNTAMDRARALGFDTPAYHATMRDFDQFSNDALGANTGAKSATMAHFFAKSPDTPNSYLPQWGMGKNWGTHLDSPPVYSELLNNKDAFARFNAADDAGKWAILEELGLNYGRGRVMPVLLNRGKTLEKDYVGGYRDMTYADILKKAKKSKKDSVTFLNTRDPGGEWGSTYLPNSETIYGIFNPANVRSRFAAFDPARINEADLLGQVRPDFLPYLFGTGLLGAYGVSQLEDK